MTHEQQRNVDRIISNFVTNPSNANKYRHELYAYIDSLQRFNPETQVAIVWSVEDVQSLDGGEALTNEEAMEVLQNFENHHEGSMESMWDDLKFHLDNWKEDKKS